MAAMLDMAFQLLAFFILTFNPGEVEAQISLLLPLENPLQSGFSQSPSEAAAEMALESLAFPVEVEAYAGSTGDLVRIKLGDQEIASDEATIILETFSQKLANILSVPGFDTVHLRVEANMRYEIFLRILDRCVQQKLASGEPLTKISITQF
ncbi:MAG: biopolymer transporter ExbD [Planctomycetes bacterium]|nr:biopolymer transporter ExbD [Planctomycetota bacterium]